MKSTLKTIHKIVLLQLKFEPNIFFIPFVYKLITLYSLITVSTFNFKD